MVSIGIIWNKSFPYKDEIIEYINNNAQVLYSCNLELNDKYEDFVRKIYDSEQMEEWKIDKKLDHMLDSDIRSICIVFFEFNDKNITFNPRKNKMVYSDLEGIKENIRSNYKDRVDNYTFDVLFHSSDNMKELKNMKIVLDEYVNEPKKLVLNMGA